MHVKMLMDKSEAVLIDDRTHLPVTEVMMFSAFLKNTSRSVNTRISYVRRLCRWYRWCETADIDPLSIFTDSRIMIHSFEAFITDMLSQNLKPSSIQTHLAAIYKYYDYLVLAGLIDRGPFEALPTALKNGNNGFLKGLAHTSTSRAIKTSLFVRRDPSHPASYVSWEQYKKILAACRNDRDRVLIGLMFECGLRIGEALGIHIEDIRLEDSTVNLKYRSNNVNHAFIKQHAERSVVMSEQLSTRLLYLLLELENYDTDYLFISMYSRNNQNGRPLTYSAVQNICNGLKKRSGVNFHPHMLRHGYAQERKNDGWEDAEISRTLGHASIESTRIYADYSEEHLRHKAREYLERREFNDRTVRKNDNDN